MEHNLNTPNGRQSSRELRHRRRVPFVPGRANHPFARCSLYGERESADSVVGLETLVGTVAIRAGYRTGGASKNSMGAGSPWAVPRSITRSLMNQLDATTPNQPGMRFGDPRSTQFCATSGAPHPAVKVVETTPATGHNDNGENAMTLAEITILRAPSINNNAACTS